MNGTDLASFAAGQFVAMSVVMSVAWIVQQRTGNSGWIDAIWTFGTGAVGIMSSLIPLPADESSTARRCALAALVALWSLRLGLHLVQRSASRPDDPRYGELVRQWGSRASREMFILLQKQALVSLPLTLSIFVAAHSPATETRVQAALAITLVVVSIAGEAISDAQLRSFSRKPENSGRVCDIGFWRYSRHPNYFFEWSFWLAFPLLAIGGSVANPWGWLAVSGPLCMYWLLRFVSGVPPLEEHMVRRYGNAYRAYQRRTSAFFPLPQRRVDRTAQ
jgi:steroid 5-alpha reductase family enzyme